MPFSTTLELTNEMKKLLYILSFFVAVAHAQETVTIKFPEHLLKTSIADLKAGDSLMYYQCHVSEGQSQLVH